MKKNSLYNTEREKELSGEVPEVIVKRPRIPGKRSLLAVTSPDLNSIPISEDIVKKIGVLADKLNVKVYCIGGYVRDYYLKRDRNDFDFTVIGDSIAFCRESG